MAQPIDVYFWPTPNGNKVSIFCEEAGLEYDLKPINISEGDQFKEEFLAISPNNKMPAIVDPDGPGGEAISIFESGAILIYLAEKTGKFFPQEPREKYRTLEWLMFQMGGVGPMLGQNHHFRQYAPEKLPYAIERYTNEAARIYGVIDKRLGQSAYLAGDEFTIADIATWPWLTNHENQGQNLDDFPNLKVWYEGMENRPAVQKAMERGKEIAEAGLTLDEKTRDTLFGKGQYQKR